MRRLGDIVRHGDGAEVVAYLPDAADAIAPIQAAYEQLVLRLENDWQKCQGLPRCVLVKPNTTECLPCIKLEAHREVTNSFFLFLFFVPHHRREFIVASNEARLPDLMEELRGGRVTSVRDYLASQVSIKQFLKVCTRSPHHPQARADNHAPTAHMWMLVSWRGSEMRR